MKKLNEYLMTGVRPRWRCRMRENTQIWPLEPVIVSPCEMGDRIMIG